MLEIRQQLKSAKISKQTNSAVLELQFSLEKESTGRIQKVYATLVSGECEGENAREGRRQEVSGSRWDWAFKKGSWGF